MEASDVSARWVIFYSNAERVQILNEECSIFQDLSRRNYWSGDWNYLGTGNSSFSEPDHHTPKKKEAM